VPYNWDIKALLTQMENPMSQMNTTSKTTRSLITSAIVIGILSLQVTQAAAVSARVRMACIADYFSYCSQHKVGSAALTQCMRANGPNLSKSCVNALVADGYASKSEVSRRAASLGK
jgi:hypothetical protein